MIDLKKQYKTRDGRDVKLYAIHPDNRLYRVVHGAIFVEYAPARWAIQDWNINGAYLEGKHSDKDLIEVKKTIEMECWLNVYPSGEAIGFSYRSLADDRALHDRAACIYIKRTVTEGEGLE